MVLKARCSTLLSYRPEAIIRLTIPFNCIFMCLVFCHNLLILAPAEKADAGYSPQAARTDASRSTPIQRPHPSQRHPGIRSPCSAPGLKSLIRTENFYRVLELGGRTLQAAVDEPRRIPAWQDFSPPRSKPGKAEYPGSNPGGRTNLETNVYNSSTSPFLVH